MTQTEHLQLIRARCVELLEIAEKRSLEYLAPRELNRRDYEIDGARIGGGCIELDGLQTHGLRCNDATFIASCAGAAEAGWRATVEAIDLASKETGDDVPYNTFDRILDSIISAWPIELLNNK
jgi:hypothetical protein